MKSILIATGLICTVAAGASADRWLSPQTQEVFSPLGRFCAQVQPQEGGALLTLSEVADGSEKQRYQRRTVNPASPVRVFVADDGTVVTLDDWGHAGFDHAVVIYAPSGAVVRDSSLSNLLTEDELKKVRQSVSSLHWYYRAEPIRILPDRLEITAVWGTPLAIDLKTGALSRGNDRFPNLVRLLKGDLTALDQVEHERWSSSAHVRCAWRDNQTICESVDPKSKATPLYRRIVPRTQLQEGHLSVLELLDAIKEPTYCAGWCWDRQEIRIFFLEGGERYFYSIVLDDFSKETPRLRNAFEKILLLLGFEDTAPGQ